MFCECSDIMVRQGSAVVLQVERLVIPAGKVSAIMGPNGAGKTTLLEVIALLRSPTRGRMSLWGQLARKNDRKLQRRIVMATHPGYMFRGGVWDNLMYGLNARGLERKESRRRVTRALDMVGLSRFARRDVAELSAGERQRINLARAIAIQPQAILLDEPTANVDFQTVEIISELLRRLRDEQGTTIVHTSPTANQLDSITDQVIELPPGSVRNNHPPIGSD